MKILTGKPYPQGATYDGAGTNFSLFSEVAERVELCLFDERGRQTQALELPERTAYCWHGYLPAVQPGQRYGFRVHGPWDPAQGQWCCPAKLLLDPYAKAIEGLPRWGPALYPSHGGQAACSAEDSARAMPRCIVVSPYFDWSGDHPPAVSLHETVIYETHVKGLTMRHPDVPEEFRGTYAGLAHPATIDYLAELGVTAVELMPVHQFVHDQHLQEQNLRNYWGYNSIGYFAPHNEYSAAGQAGQQVQEFKQMVKRLHQAGIEVILDVVYNHTAEGNHQGPMLSLRGIDNAAYYRLDPGNPLHYIDFTGTGNTLNMQHPQVLRLIMDSLRYWVTEMHVDGFRFDLASALARELHDVDRLSAFFDIIHQDPVIGQVKLIAEPWDVGEGGYQVGKFPVQWSEWNGEYRDSVRDYWRGTDRSLGEFANRFTGSADLYEDTGRRPHASVNFVTAHDGFTLADLVSYNDRHNDANPDPAGGHDDNRSWNSGVEGPTDDADVCALRARQQRNFLTTLLLSQGIPMVCGGDEIGRTQRGNNNAYCQDNELSWYDWDAVNEGLLEFTRRLIALRREHPVFRRWKWFQGRPLHGAGVEDVGWYRPDGKEMTEAEWNAGHARSLLVCLSGRLKSLDARGEPVVDDDFCVLFNAAEQGVEFIQPPALPSGWVKVLDTEAGAWPEPEPPVQEERIILGGRSIVVLRHAQ